MKRFPPSTEDSKEVITDYNWTDLSGDCLSMDLVLYQAGDYICRQGSEQMSFLIFSKAGRLSTVLNGSDTILEIKTWTLRRD